MEEEQAASAPAPEAVSAPELVAIMQEEQAEAEAVRGVKRARSNACDLAKGGGLRRFFSSDRIGKTLVQPKPASTEPATALGTPISQIHVNGKADKEPAVALGTPISQTHVNGKADKAGGPKDELIAIPCEQKTAMAATTVPAAASPPLTSRSFNEALSSLETLSFSGNKRNSHIAA